MKLSKAWQAALPGFLLGLLALLWLFRDTGLAMVEIWNRSETFAHAFVVPPISLWLIWRQRALLASLNPRPAPLCLLLIAALCALWLFAELAVVNAATQFALVGLIVLLVPATLGWQVARSIAFPLGFLFFSVPFGEFVMPQLMEWTADFTVTALRLSGIPVFREGLQFVIPSGSWSVVEACSGIRYLMASVMVGTLFAYLNYRSHMRRWIFVGVAIVLPLAANWIRAYLIVLLGHVSGNKLAAGADHLVYGWVFFGAVMLLMFMIGARWSEPDAQPGVAASEVNVVPKATDAAAALSEAGDVRSMAVRTALTLAGLLVLLGTPHFFLHSILVNARSADVTLAAPDLSDRGWALQTGPAPVFTPAFENPRAVLQASYAKPGEAAVGLYLGYYRHQSFNSKLISSNNVLVTSKDAVWSQVASGSREQASPVYSMRVRTAELRRKEMGHEGVAGSRLRVWQLYWINGRLLTSDWQAKLYGAFDRLIGRGDDAAVLVFYADQSTLGPDEALLSAFARDNLEAFTTLLKATRDAALLADGQGKLTAAAGQTSRAFSP
ncbi:exosortase A [Roseateles sp. PN1]|uniref:exosortase A n=1 Tax=Roseateles sp. PN1 TaxID=3137372 RepID=UPI00313A4864